MKSSDFARVFYSFYYFMADASLGPSIFSGTISHAAIGSPPKLCSHDGVK